MLRRANLDGYFGDNAEAKVCQDVILKAISESALSRNVTIKGGVVMRSISNDTRRATQDMDIDFIRYSLEDDSIRRFIKQLDCLDGIHLSQIGDITELRQQDYNGKRAFVIISDDTGDSIESKLDLGVHKNIDIEQEEYCFDIGCYDGSATLLINSKEQMFTEKLRSLLKFGSNSTRYKDIFDMFYLVDRVEKDGLLQCINMMVISNPSMKENDMEAIVRRVSGTFFSKRYLDKLTNSKKNWIGEDISVITGRLIEFLESLEGKHDGRL